MHFAVARIHRLASVSDWMENETPPNPAESADARAFTSSHTSNFPNLLRELRISLLVSTYQAGKLIVVRADGDSLNTHFRDFLSPMGLAYEPGTGRLAVGTRHEVWQFFNQSAVAPKAPPLSRHDAAFLPRKCHISGDIRIHEIGWVRGELWAVNTRFSCLCTFDELHSFVPRWRPPFITTLAAEDRCHLNGMAIVDGQVKYVSCLGRTDTAGGWRENKRQGGALLDVESGEAVLTGMCMPHSPRRYAGRDWILESGIGALSAVDLAAGKREIVAKLPGFTRGLDFCRNIAFIGLSQVRETAIFSGIPVAAEERSCGVWAVDLRTGQVVAFLRFEGIVQEIFAVEVLPEILYPDVINEAGDLLDGSFVLPSEEI
jgi:uncharacterized protein (TIGR03032 family)